jgi:hypothetical protein
MYAILQLLLTFVANQFRSRRRLEVENLFLRHQLNIALGVHRTLCGFVARLLSGVKHVADLRMEAC